MNNRAQILLLVRSRRYGESLAAVLGTLEGVELAMNSLPLALPGSRGEASLAGLPTVLLAEDGALLEPARRLWPGCRTVLLVEGANRQATRQERGGQGVEVDATLPRDVSAGRLLATVRGLIA